MMNMRNLRSVILCSGLLLFAACTKSEFLPDPAGSQVPFQPEATKTVEELLAASPAKLYYSAWQKSNIKTILKAKSSKLVYTVFAPNDAAMQAAGLTADAIGQMPVAKLDSLMMFYTTLGFVTERELKQRTDNFVVKTLLQQPGLYLPYFENPNSNQYDLYYYRNYVGLKGESLLVNGKNLGKLNYAPAVDGGLYILEKAIEKPTKTILEALTADGRFTIFLESQRLADESYIEAMINDMEPLFGYRPEPEEVLIYITSRKLYTVGWGINAPIYQGYIGPNITISTLFAPTDEAFHKAGFQTLADVMKFNERGASSIHFDESLFTGVGGFPMDTVYNFHRDWGRMFQPQTTGGDKALANTTIFYGNVLNAELNDYMVNVGGNAPAEFAYKMPIEFSSVNNSVQMKAKGSSYPAATVTETDINTLNGPIHVVDRLIFPKGFKLN
ncbi:fasciclin domain-containing protein [Pedobacter polysacchareus]|uniref:fasciclin domain-containing protein n=1 Tax=Pedobacter polysacchareus TaxID=2861973 RepID=UPI001C993CD8|nr:fasciclin domain-containing protein [Pedobacter polysacchareus]